MKFGAASNNKVMPVPPVIIQMDPVQVCKCDSVREEIISLIPKLPELQILEQKVIERTEVVKELTKEVSIVTKDKRSRRHTKLVSEKLNRQQIHIRSLNDQIEQQDSVINNLKDLVHKLRLDLDKLDTKQQNLESLIPEEKQEVKLPSFKLLYVTVGISFLFSVLGLLIK